MKHTTALKNLTTKQNRLLDFPTDLFCDYKKRRNTLATLSSVGNGHFVAFYKDMGSYLLSRGDTLDQISNEFKMVRWAGCFPCIATFHTDQNLVVFNIETKRRIVVDLDGCDCMAMNNNLIAVLYKNSLKLYSVNDLTLLDNIPFPQIHTNPNEFKFFGHLLLCSKFEKLRVLDTISKQMLLVTSSKDGSPFLQTTIAENQVIATSDQILNVWNLAANAEHHEISLKSPASCLLAEKGKVFVGSEGLVTVYDARHYTKINEINPQSFALQKPTIAAPEPELPFLDDSHLASDPDIYGNSENSGDSNMTVTLEPRGPCLTPYNAVPQRRASKSKVLLIKSLVSAIKVVEDFIVIASMDGKCGVWNYEKDKGHVDPIISFQISEDSHVSQIISTTRLLYFLEQQGDQHVGIGLWRPDFKKISSLHSERFLAGIIPKVRAGRRHVIQQWVDSNKPGMKDENFLKKIQRLTEEQYPWLAEVSESCTITNNTQDENPIVFVSDEFCEMTGYTREEIYGRNCRFLQGKYTDREVVKRISSATRVGAKISVEILNYRKDGSPFWNVLAMFPVHDKKGAVLAFFALQKDFSHIKLSNMDPNMWRSEEVAMWLDEIGMSQYSHLFIEKQVMGQQLLSLTDKAMSEIGVTLENCTPLLEKIELLRNQDKST